MKLNFAFWVEGRFKEISYKLINYASFLELNKYYLII